MKVLEQSCLKKWVMKKERDLVVISKVLPNQLESTGAQQGLVLATIHEKFDFGLKFKANFYF